MRRLFPLAAAVVIGATSLSCGGGGGDTTAPPVLTTLTVSVPSGPIAVGQSITASAAGLDQNGSSIATGTIVWSSDNTAVATVDGNGSVLGVGAGTTQIKASAGGKQAQATITVFLPPVATVTVSPPTATMTVGQQRQFLATTTDATGNVLSGRVVTWESSDASKATVNATTGMVAAVANGPVTITATSEGKSGTSQVTVSDAPVNCTPGLQMAVGELHALSSTERNSLCLGGGASTSEYVLIPFNTSTVASGMVSLQIAGTNTAAIQPGQLASVQPVPGTSGLKQGLSQASFELAFRKRELEDLAPVMARTKRAQQSAAQGPGVSYLTGIVANPSVGDVVQINTNLSGNTCTSAKQLHDARVVAVLTHTLVLVDVAAPANGYTDAELLAFGQAFESDGYPLDVQNFGAPPDFDGNGREAILFTQAVNEIPVAGGVVLGLFAARDLFPVAAGGLNGNCVGSNEGEMFYVPVPDVGRTLNTKYSDKAALSNTVLATLVHEFQHLINAGRRIYVNNANSFEDLWLNEGLSHIAEELLYYRISGNPPRSNIDVNLLRSSQAQLNAVNTYQINNLSRLSIYMQSPELNSPYAQVDGFEMRGAIWQLLRYSADRKGGTEESTWFALVNSTTSGQQNFSNVFGNNIVNLTRDWAIAQFADDSGLGVGATFSQPSWNFRSVLPAINSSRFPLLTHALAGAPVDITLAGGGAAYVRFSVQASIPATITTNSSGQPIPSGIDLILLRTQ